jgi:hypothetical protein
MRRRVLASILLAVVLGVPATIWGAFELGHVWAEQRLTTYEEQVEQLRADKQQLNNEVTKLQERLGELQGSQAMRSGEVKELRDLVSRQQNKINDLQKEVGFYRNILDPDKADRDVAVNDFQLDPLGGGANEYGYSFKLVQGVAKKDVMEGYARVAVVYLTPQGEEKVVFFPEGSNYRRRGMEAEFRYFQEFSGMLEIPEKAQPVRVTVQLFSPDGRRELLKKRFPWEKLMAAQTSEEGSG